MSSSAPTDSDNHLQRVTRLLKLSGEVAKFGGWRVDIQEMTVEWSKQTAAIYGLDEAVILPVDAAIAFYAPESAERIGRAFFNCIETGKRFDEVLQLITKQRVPIWVRSVGEAERDARGNIIAVYGALQDISELVEARLQAEKLNQRLYETLEHISDAFITLDSAFCFVYLNEQAERLLNKQRQSLVGHNIWHVFPEARGSSFELNYIAVMQDKTTRRFTEFYPPLNAWFEVSVYPVADGLAIYFRDVTERIEMEDKLRHAQKMESIGHLTGGIAHDFNNLLTVLLGNAELLSEQLEQPDLKALADISIKAALRGAELTSRLLAFARKQPLAPKAVCVGQLLQNMLPMLKRTLAENIEINIDVDEAIRSVEIDPGQLEVALLNLAINARDAMPEGGRLSFIATNVVAPEHEAALVALQSQTGFISLAVCDSGVGMSEATLTRAIEPFFTTKGPGQGSGLGLSMVYGFVNQSGGALVLKSRPNKGTEVRLFLPTSLDTRAVENQQSEKEQLPKGCEHIFVVEDDELVRNHIVAQLIELGYSVSQAKSGIEALALFGQLPRVDLLFTDIVMPDGINGRELAEQLLLIQPDLKVLFSSGYSDTALIHQGRLDKDVHLLSKPYRRKELAEMVRMVLDQ